MIQLAIKEFNSFLNSLIAYLVIGVFLTGIGLMVWVFPESSILNYGYASLDPMFAYAPFVYIFLIPAITMRSFAEEKKIGTLEWLMSKPLSDWDIILGKYMASGLLVFLSILPTGIYVFALNQLGDPVGNFDLPGIMGSYLGLLLLGGVFCAAGIMASSFTSNQLTSFVWAAFISFILYSGFDSISLLVSWPGLALSIKQLGIVYHYDALSKGVIDSRDVLYFISVTYVLLLSTKIILGSRLW